MQYIKAVINDKKQYLAGCLKIILLHCLSCALITVSDGLLQHQYSKLLSHHSMALQCPCIPLHCHNSCYYHDIGLLDSPEVTIALLHHQL